MDPRTTRADDTSRPVNDATAAHAPVWTDAVPVPPAATAAHAPVWTDAVPTADDATAAHQPVWTAATVAPADDDAAEDDADDKAPAFELSVTAVLASAGAAVCAAILGSQLGVAGTILGAALGAVVSMTAGAVFSHSLQTARHQLQRSVAAGGPLYARAALAGVGRGPRRQAEALTTAVIAAAGVSPARSGSMAARTTAVPPPSERAWGQVPDAGAVLQSGPVRGAAEPSTSSTTPRRRRRTVWALTGGALAGFGLAVLAITGYEMISGTPVSGGDQGGLSVLGGGTTGSPDAVTTPTTPTEGRDPSSSSSTTSSEESTVTSTTTVTATDDPSSSTSASTSGSGATSTSSTTTDAPSSTTGTSETPSSPNGTTGDQTATTTTTQTGAG